MAIITFIKNNYIMINTGFLEDDRVRISKKPTLLYLGNVVNKSIAVFDDHTLDDYGWEIVKNAVIVKEFDYTIRPDRRIVLIDIETGEEIKPYFAHKSDRTGKIKMDIWKKYFAFEIRSKSSIDYTLSDFEIGYAYKYGKYRLKQNYEKALYYLRIAAAVGDIRAKKELVESCPKKSYRTILSK